MSRALASLCVLVLLTCTYSAARAQSYEGYYKYLGSYPSGETDWSNDAQGVAHDSNHWFITNTHGFWRIPVEVDLDDVTSSSPGVIHRDISDYPQLTGYNHFGDPDVFRFGTTDYLVLPIEDSEANCQSGLPGAIAILRCDSLCYVAHAPFTNQCNDAGWCAIDRSGLVYSSVQHPGFENSDSLLLTYSLDWSSLACDSQFQMTYLGAIPMIKEDGAPLEMGCMQGGEFAPDGRLLYLISGFLDDDDEEAVREGIHVVDTTSWQRVEHSTNGNGNFNYYYNPGYGFPCCLDPGCCTANEPEGLTIWDLDDGRAPGILGQLHAFMSDNDTPVVDSGDIRFYHYTRANRVNPTAQCVVAPCCLLPGPSSCLSGSNSIPCGEEAAGLPSCPYNTITAALSAAWAGSEIRLSAGTFPGPLTISTPVRLSAEGGVARIGG